MNNKESHDFWLQCQQPVKVSNPMDSFKIVHIDLEKVPVSRSFNRKFIFSVLRAFLVLSGILLLLGFLLYLSSYSKASLQVTSIVALYPAFVAMQLFFLMITDEPFWKIEYEYIEVTRDDQS
jgi:hypothetical protein